MSLICLDAEALQLPNLTWALFSLLKALHMSINAHVHLFEGHCRLCAASCTGTSRHVFPYTLSMLLRGTATDLCLVTAPSLQPLLRPLLFRKHFTALTTQFFNNSHLLPGHRGTATPSHACWSPRTAAPSSQQMRATNPCLCCGTAEPATPSQAYLKRTRTA
jgi:hypothetical protein